MTPLTEHFDLEEFLSENDPNKPNEVQVNLLRVLCESFLEPVRRHYGQPVKIHSGYRSPEYNARPAVNGAVGSYHLCTSGHAAADFEVVSFSYEDVFKAIRLESFLPFDELILERTHVPPRRPACIHVQIRTDEDNRYLAKEGETHNTSGYTAAQVIRGWEPVWK